jgi:N-acetylglucosamine kinase-like BadF-type ATPase
VSDRALVGLDIGGTKSAVVVERLDGTRLVETTVASDDWDAEPLEHGVRWVTELVRATLPPGVEVAALGLGAQGLDTDALARQFSAAMPWPTTAVNDAALLVPAAGLEHGLGVIAGTGSIGVGRDAHGAALVTGGWGWVIGDEAGAAGIVREATRAALFAHDDGPLRATGDGTAPHDAADPLLAALLDAFGVGDAERLARAVNDEPTMANWGPRAPAVFAAADAGSALAARVIDGAAQSLARLVDQLVARGAVGSDVVAAGSVIVGQPRLYEGFAEWVAVRHPSLDVRLLTAPPVEGAVALARRMLVTEPTLNQFSTKE